MKSFKQFLSPSWPEGYEELLKKINDDCAPWLKMTKNIKPNALFRGISDHEFISKQLNKIAVRGDRKPRDSTERVHKELNYFLQKTFNFPYRSGSVFASPRHGVASSYAWTRQNGQGRTCLIFPIGDFDFCFSLRHNDVSWWIDSNWTPTWMNENGNDINEYLIALRKMLFANKEIQYVENEQLAKAFETNKELMIKCKSYYAVPLEGISLIDYDTISADEFLKDVYDFV